MSEGLQSPLPTCAYCGADLSIPWSVRVVAAFRGSFVSVSHSCLGSARAVFQKQVKRYRDDARLDGIIADVERQALDPDLDCYDNGFDPA